MRLSVPISSSRQGHPMTLPPPPPYSAPNNLASSKLWSAPRGLNVATEAGARSPQRAVIFACPMIFSPGAGGGAIMPMSPASRLSCTATDSPTQQASQELPKRTRTSRREHQRQKGLGMKAPEERQPWAMQQAHRPGSALTMESIYSMSTEAQEASDDGPTMVWPPTPESTPPSSPRIICSPNSAASWAASPESTESSPPSTPRVSRPAGKAVAAVKGAPGTALAISDAEAERILAQLSGDDPNQCRRVIPKVQAAAWSLAFTSSGCRVLQKALEVAELSEQCDLLEPLKGHVVTAAASPHGNHVLQKAIQILPADRVTFMLEEMIGHADAAARSRYGCRVLERLIEHLPSHQTSALVAEILDSATNLIRHCFGNFVIQHILLHGTQSQRRRIAEILELDATRLARHRIASHVMRSALVNCASNDRQRLVQVLVADTEDYAEMMHHHCGSFVAREIKRTATRK